MMWTKRLVVNQTLGRRVDVSRSRWALPWMFTNLTAAVVIYVDMCQGIVASFLSVSELVLWYTELFFFVTFSLNTLVNLFTYLKPFLMAGSLRLTDSQKKLLAVQDLGTGGIENMPSPLPAISPSSPSPNASFMTSTPINMSAASWAHSFSSPSPGSSPNMSMTSTSWSYQPNKSPNHKYSYSKETSSFSPQEKFGGPFQLSNSLSNGLRMLNLSNSFAECCDEPSITDEPSLNKYLKTYEQEEERSQKMVQSESPPSFGSSFWSLGHTLLDYSPLLRKYSYQLSTRSSQSASNRPDNDPDSPAHHAAEEVWSKVGVSSEELFKWTENLRKWLTQTILGRLVSEIDSINDVLRRMGSPDLQIGEIGLTTLRQVALMKSQLIPTLNLVLPYLEASSNQEYLVKRVRELAGGGCMSQYSWNGGGKFKDKPWGTHLPTDSAIVIHLFCSYLDCRLPPHPNYPDGKTFTSQCFFKAQDKPNPNKETLCLYNTTTSPPHFKVIIGEEVWDLPKGRNNLFHAILLFLHHIKTKENGMLGRVNLGLSGINLLWTFGTSHQHQLQQ